MSDSQGEQIIRALLQHLGEDPEREGLRDTPRRVLQAYRFWCSGYHVDPREVLRTFEDGAERYDEMVVVSAIPTFSLCEHHLAPFFGLAHVGYIPQGRIVGLSKVVRLVDCFARRLQVQERLTAQIADALEEHLAPQAVGVVLECRHMCMESRGVRSHKSVTVTSSMRGAFRGNHAAKAELLSLKGRHPL